MLVGHHILLFFRIFRDVIVTNSSTSFGLKLVLIGTAITLYMLLFVNAVPFLLLPTRFRLSLRFRYGKLSLFCFCFFSLRSRQPPPLP